MNCASDPDPVLLFSYGTLQQENVQLATFGRRLEGRSDALPGYRLFPLRIEDAQVVATSGEEIHMIARPSGDPSDRVPGSLFEITREELDTADRYEVGDYARIAVRLESGAQAWFYAAAENGGSN